uniref:NADH-ubiquinone oxidoreductase chain 6 n=1 Tax=Melanobaris laticollis TaxID=1069881 RepID=J9PJP6_9CUCU|nr:NADH dehydrogenase subunit 6 [Melanobaris laticollis]
MFYMFLLNWTISLTFMFLNHPLSLGGTLLIQTIMISLMTGLMYKTFFFSYILFMIMIGGMLVMFIYMTSIASNEKFKMPKMILLFYSMMFFLILITLMMDNFYFNFPLMNFTMPSKFINFTLNKFFNLPNMKMLLILIFYLFITLIAIVKIIGKKHSTPPTKMNDKIF